MSDCRDCRLNDYAVLEGERLVVYCPVAHGVEFSLGEDGLLDINCAVFVKMSALEKAIRWVNR